MAAGERYESATDCGLSEDYGLSAVGLTASGREAGERQRVTKKQVSPPMKVTLKPISHPQMGEIQIVDDLFAIGRNEEPFASRLGDAATRLSRRHARIFQEDGKVFIADLGSLNGTRVNDKPLKKGATVLQPKDVIMLGDEFSFRVEIEREAPQSKTLLRTPSVRLTLAPVDSGSGIEAIRIERFPFLIARIDNAFEQYKERFPDALRKLSRRHAVIALKGDQVYIEDLESSNGTFIGGKRLDERAQRLADGDTVMFGSEHFCYRVRVESDSEATRLAETLMVGPGQTVVSAANADAPVAASRSAPAAASAATPSAASASTPAAASQSAPAPEASDQSPESGNRTRFVSSADSFINVFCAEDEPDPAADAAHAAEDTARVPAVKAPAGILQRMWGAFRGDAGFDRRVAWATVGALAFLVVAGLSAFLIGFDRREIRSLLDDGKYEASALAANRYLKKHPDDVDAAAWGQEALAKAVAPTWAGLIEKKRFDEAADYLQKQKQAHAFNRRGQEMIALLSWAGKVEAHMAERGGATAPVVMFRDEEPIRALVAEWDSDSSRHQQLMDQLVTQAPAFESVHSQVFGNLRELRTQNSLYVKAMDELKIALGKALRDSDREEVNRLINEFAASYPRVGGLDALKHDVAQYDTLVRLVDDKELQEVVRLSRTVKFRTPIFEDYVGGWLASTLPPADIVAKYAAAADAWRSGKGDEAIAMLEPLTDQPWGEVAAGQIERYRKIGADYETLLASKGGARYWDNLLALWGSLRPQEDEYVLRQLQPDFIAHKEEMLPRLEESYRRVRTSWDAYQRAGGIPGVIRVEGHVSAKFTEQARRLSSAYEEITSGAQTYQLLQVMRPPDWQALEEQVVSEAQRQRRWLQDLSIVLEPTLLKAKLDLLPQLPEQASWVQSTTAQDGD
jgi:pSer/pThr/pTyr-binding forkhead associated (FHA) protein